MIAPCSNYRRVDQDRSVREQPIHSCLQIRNLKREPNLPANALARFYLINSTGLLFIKNLQCGLTHIKDHCLTLIVCPDLRWFQTEAIAIESY